MKMTLNIAVEIKVQIFIYFGILIFLALCTSQIFINTFTLQNFLLKHILKTGPICVTFLKTKKKRGAEKTFGYKVGKQNGKIIVS